MKQSVNFKSKTNLLAANLYTPEQFDESKNIHQLQFVTQVAVLKNKQQVCMQRNLRNSATLRLYMMHHIKVKVKALLDI